MHLGAIMCDLSDHVIRGGIFPNRIQIDMLFAMNEWIKQKRKEAYERQKAENKKIRERLKEEKAAAKKAEREAKDAALWALVSKGDEEE